MVKKRVHVIIRGHVQGVLFRYSIKKNALVLGLTGWVKNKTNGTVEVITEGEEENLKELVKFCRQGPSRADVTGISVDWDEYKGEFEGFRIRY